MTDILLMLSMQVAQVAKEVVQTLPPSSTESLKPYVMSAASIYFIQKWMKQHPYYTRFVQAFPGADKWAHRGIAGVWSFIFALGVHWAYAGDLAHGYQATIQIPAFDVLIERGKDFVTVYLSQQITYECANKPPWQPAAPVPVTDTKG